MKYLPTYSYFFNEWWGGGIYIIYNKPMVIGWKLSYNTEICMVIAFMENNRELRRNSGGIAEDSNLSNYFLFEEHLPHMNTWIYLKLSHTQQKKSLRTYSASNSKKLFRRSMVVLPVAAVTPPFFHSSISLFSIKTIANLNFAKFREL